MIERSIVSAKDRSRESDESKDVRNSLPVVADAQGRLAVDDVMSQSFGRGLQVTYPFRSLPYSHCRVAQQKQNVDRFTLLARHWARHRHHNADLTAWTDVDKPAFTPGYWKYLTGQIRSSLFDPWFEHVRK